MTPTTMITKFLKKNKMYDNVDQFLVDELVFNLKICSQVRQDLIDPYRKDALTLVVNVTVNEEKQEFFQQHRLLPVYNQALKNVISIMQKLALNPNERAKLKIELSQIDDEYGAIFKEE